ncbi:SRPBCC domain-containing protein [Streptomyces sp. NPDC002779]|uniref:SRPBCC domain-containing protein n=1 Tax=Streptomyces sp. NPDC002779 TaxID=3364664 RepID=UPI0036C9BDD0
MFVPVSTARLREALSDPARVARALPGLQQDAGARTPMSGRLKVRVGGHTITYRGVLRLAPREDGTYAVEGDATEARGTGSVKLSLTLRVSEAEDGSTLTFDATATADGRIAQLPPDQVDSAMTRLLTRFAENLPSTEPQPDAALTRPDREPAAPEPETAAPETAGPATSEPETAAPKTAAPKTAAPEPETAGAETAGPAASESEAPAAETAKSATSEREPAAPENTKPATPESKAPAPETPAPDTAAAEPEAPAAETAKPATPEPETPAPEAPEPADVVETPPGPPPSPDGEEAPQAAPEAAHARRTMIGRSAEEVDHAPPRGRYAPVPAPHSTAPVSALRWAAPAAALAVASAIVVSRALRRRR